MATKPTPKNSQKNREKEKERSLQSGQEAMKKNKADNKAKKNKEKKPKINRRRVLPIWLRILIVLILSALALVCGVMIGYGVIGDGNPTDALKWETWKHIWNIATKTE